MGGAKGVVSRRLELLSKSRLRVGISIRQRHLLTNWENMS